MSTSEFSLKDKQPNWKLLAGITVGVGSLVYAASKLQWKKHPTVPSAPEFSRWTGHTLWWKKHFANANEDLRELLLKESKTKDLVAMSMPGGDTVFILKPELIEYVFTLEFNKFFKGPEAAYRFGDIFGKYGQAIFVADGKDWRFHRKIGSRMFSLRNLKEYMYKCCVDTSLTTMSKLNELKMKGITIDINDILGRMTFDCFTTIAFGVKFDSMSLYPQQHPFGYAFDSSMREITRRNFDILWEFKKYLNIGYEGKINGWLKTIKKFSDDVISQRNNTIQNFQDENKKTFDLFSLYKKFNPELSNEDMKFIALNFIIAGRDTTRTLLSWFLFDMTQYNDIKKRVIEEIRNLKELNFKSLSELKYTEACLCESLRYHPVVPSSVRTAKADIVIPKRVVGKEILIKKGDRLWVHNFSVAKSEYFYKEPNKYNPDRFIEKGVKTFPVHIYPFFNQNPRLCLGREFALMEAKIFLVHFLKKYNYELIPNQKIIPEPGVILNMKYGLKVNLKEV